MDTRRRDPRQPATPAGRRGGVPLDQAVDRGRKLAEYRIGGARLYLLADVPTLSPRGDVEFELHDFQAGSVTSATGQIEVAIERQVVRFDTGAVRLGM